MAKNQNTFAKMQREKEKKRKADEKRNRRRARKSQDLSESSAADTQVENPADDDRSDQDNEEAGAHGSQDS